MVFGLQKLQNDLFCVTEERDYFQAKYLEQVSEIRAIKEQLRNARREIKRMRKEIMAGAAEDFDEMSSQFSSSLRSTRSRRSISPLTNEDDFDKDNQQPRSTNDKEADEHDGSDNEEEDEEEEDEEEEDIRQNAAKLLHWADYRASERSMSSSRRMMQQQSEASDTLPSTPTDQLSAHSLSSDALLGTRPSPPLNIPRTIPSEDQDKNSGDDDASDLDDDEDEIGNDDIETKRSLVDKFEELVTSL